jgi:hypothetical protein
MITGLERDLKHFESGRVRRNPFDGKRSSTPSSKVTLAHSNY